jgi:hypothetical protein
MRKPDRLPGRILKKRELIKDKFPTIIHKDATPLPAHTIRSRRASAKVFFIDYIEIDIIRCLVRFGLVSHDPPQIPPDKK